MKIVLFCHSLLSDWNHGNAHFLRGVATELIHRGHDLHILEPRDNWSLQNLIQDGGAWALEEFHQVYPTLKSTAYDLESLDLNAVLDGADLVLMHEWNDPALVHRVGQHRAQHDYKLLFHDTHHRAATAPHEMAAFDLGCYDGVLAFGNVIRDLYLQNNWTRRAWTWHEAADVRVFQPQHADKTGDLVWIGNWGDDERTRELFEFLIEPIHALKLKARVHGVRYPDEAKAALLQANIEYGGWLPNFRAPETLARFKVTVHVPRRPYVKSLPGIPTIRPFEALACGIPLVCAGWHDVEKLFRAGKDYLTARDGEEMRTQLQTLLNEPQLAQQLSEHGRQTILARHTCAHRVDELLTIYQEL